MPTSTKTAKTETQAEHDEVSVAAERLTEARDSLRLAQEQHDETQNRLDTFRKIVRSGGSLPKGKTIAGVEDELGLSALRIEGLAEDVAGAEDEHAHAVASEVAEQVRSVVCPLATGERAKEAWRAIAEILTNLADDQQRANAVIRQGHGNLKALPEDRYGKARRVGGVGIDPNGLGVSVRIDGLGYEVIDPTAQAQNVLKNAETLLLKHLATG